MTIIPNDIYFCILDHIAPPNERLAQKEVRAFTNLSSVCRFFTNFCLPHVFEFLEFPGSNFHRGVPFGLRVHATYETPRKNVLCTAK